MVSYKYTPIRFKDQWKNFPQRRIPFLDWFRQWKPCLSAKVDLHGLEAKIADLSRDKLAEIIADCGSEDEFEGFTLDDLEPNICNSIWQANNTFLIEDWREGDHERPNLQFTAKPGLTDMAELPDDLEPISFFKLFLNRLTLKQSHRKQIDMLTVSLSEMELHWVSGVSAREWKFYFRCDYYEPVTKDGDTVHYMY